MATFVKEVFDLMFCLESDEMTGLWPNDSFTFTFYMIFSSSIPILVVMAIVAVMNILAVIAIIAVNVKMAVVTALVVMVK